MVALAALPMIGVLAATAGTTDARGVAITCDYDIQSRTLDVAVTPDGGQVQLFRSGDDITVFTNEDPPTQVVCSGNQQATVDNTNLVNVHSDGQDAVLFIDLSGGPFAPGFSNEDDDSPEVEFDVSLPGSQSEIDIYGTSDVDTVSAGSLGSDKGMNLNAAEVTADTDVTFDAHFLGFVGQGGGDLFSADGDGAGFDEPFNGRAFLFGGSGDDHLEGGRKGDQVFGNGGHDKMLGRDGNDQMFSREGKSDVVKCGADSDLAVVDLVDEYHGCEDLRRAARNPARNARALASHGGAALVPARQLHRR